MTCKLCNQNKKLIKAHIIPGSFFKLLRTSKLSPEMHTNTSGIHPKRSPTGIYDKGILCEQCEMKFDTWDNHAQKVLLKDFSEDLAIYENKIKAGYKISNLDYKLLKLFFISLLWRASVSTHEFYHRVSAGPFEEKLKQMILEDNPGSSDMFSVTLSKFSDPRIVEMLDPDRFKCHGLNYYRFYIAGYVAYIKVDKRPPVDYMDRFKLKPNEPLLVILRDLHRSKDGAVMKKIKEKSMQYHKANSKTF